MLPDVPPLRADAAERWLGAGVPHWVPRIGLTGLWVVALAVAIFSDDAACSAADPAVCGPDQTFAFWFTVACATPVLLLWMPLAGCAAGVLFGVADLVWDEVPAANVAFGLHAVLCAAVALWLVRAGSAQERLVAPQTRPAQVPAAVAAAAEDRGGWYLPPLLAVGALLVVASGCFGWYLHASSGEQAHVARAERVEARVVEVDDENWTVTVEARASSSGMRERYRLDVLEDYPVDSVVPVLVDPLDASWARLVAEPQDITWWETLGYGAVLLAAVLLGRELARRRAVPRLLTREAAAVRVLTVPDENGDVLVLPFGARAGDRPIARVPVAWLRGDDVPDDPVPGSDQHPEWAEDGFGHWDEETQASFGRAWRGERPLDDESEAFSVEDAEPRPGVLLGVLRDRGWAVVVTEEGTLVPAAPMRVGRVVPDDRPWWMRVTGLDLPARLRASRPSPEPEPDDVLPGSPVDARSLGRFPELPVTARPPVLRRVLGLSAVVVGLLGGPIVALTLAEGWYQPPLALLIGFEVMTFGLDRALPRVVVGESEGEVHGAWRLHVIPWASLHGVRRSGGELHLAWEPDLLVLVGPFQTAPGLDRDLDAEQLGALMLTLRTRSGSASSRADRALPTSRPGPAWGYATAYALLTIATLWHLLTA